MGVRLSVRQFNKGFIILLLYVLYIGEPSDQTLVSLYIADDREQRKRCSYQQNILKIKICLKRLFYCIKRSKQVRFFYVCS